MRGLLLAACLVTSGCAYTVRLLSEPTRATVTLPSGDTVVTPAEARFRSGKRQLVQVQAIGYRPLVVDMNRTEARTLRLIGGALFQRGGREVTFLLVEEHGPVGTGAP